MTKCSRSQSLQTTNSLIARPLSGSPNCALYYVSPVWGQCFPLTHTINVAHLTQQQQVKLAKSLAMTRLGPSIEPIIFPTPSRCNAFFATYAGLGIDSYLYCKILLLIYKFHRYSTFDILLCTQQTIRRQKKGDIPSTAAETSDMIGIISKLWFMMDKRSK